jgi:hypothetical protein
MGCPMGPGLRRGERSLKSKAYRSRKICESGTAVAEASEKLTKENFDSRNKKRTIQLFVVLWSRLLSDFRCFSGGSPSMPKIRSVLVPAALCLVLLAPAAADAAGRKAAPPALAQLDADHSGTVNLDEVKKAADARFDALDTDHDGKLETKELNGLVSPRAFKKVDTDNDGTLDKAEFESIATYHFQKADKAQNGKLDVTEMKSYQGKALAKLLGLSATPAAAPAATPAQ